MWRIICGMDSYSLGSVLIISFGIAIPNLEVNEILEACYILPAGGHHRGILTTSKSLQCGYYIGPWCFEMFIPFVVLCLMSIEKEYIQDIWMPLSQILEITLFDYWGIDFMGSFPRLLGNKYIVLVVYYVSKWVEAMALPLMKQEVLKRFSKRIFSHVWDPKNYYQWFRFTFL